MNPKKDFIKYIKSVIKCIRIEKLDPFYSNVAPGLAYYFLLSIAPIMITLSYITGLVFSSSFWLEKAVNEILPKEISDTIIPFLSSQSNTSGLITTVFVFIFTLYLASKGIYALIKVADYASDNFDTAQIDGSAKTFIRRHIKAIVLTFMMIFMLVISLLFMVFGKVALDLAVEHIHIKTISVFIYDFYKILTYPLGMALLCIILLLFYSKMPTKHLPFKEVLPGAVFASLGLVLASMGFAMYLRFFFNSNAIYGALSSIIVLILWFFLISHVLVLGIIVNKAFKEIKKQ